ncbi:uncharacterized protein si:ch211-157b11.14 [Esox lucius]|uniref:uncharacterized protein si:ch211-157b11.14 n=1 Tax=Esox lucius TaxID=8010 RepID=UPI001476CF73|nr:uncharacterized protein si:ch211-157b11.14 [Esox lucius]
MDDLDHSVHIAEHDWDCFYDESEECSLPLPDLAGSDDSGLSEEEPEDSGIHTVQHDIQQQQAASNTAIVSQSRIEEQCTVRKNIYLELPLKPCQVVSEETQLNDPLAFTEEDGGSLQDMVSDNMPQTQEVSDVDYIVENRDSGYFVKTLLVENPGETTEEITEETASSQDITNDLGSAPECCSNMCRANSDPSGDCHISNIKGVDGEMPSKGVTGTLNTVPTPLYLESVSLPLNDRWQGQNICQEQLLRHTDRAVLCERGTSEASKGEKERWFVTVNDSPMPHRVHAHSTTKKKKKKKPCRNLFPRDLTLQQLDPPTESESEKEKDVLDGLDRQEAMFIKACQSCYESQHLPKNHILLDNFYGEIHKELPKINFSYSELPPLFSELSLSSSFTEKVNIYTKASSEKNYSSEVFAPETFIENNKQENYSLAIGLQRSADHPLSKLQDLLFAQCDEDEPQHHPSESGDSNEEVELFYTTSTSCDSEEDYVSATEMKDSTYTDPLLNEIESTWPSKNVTDDSQPLIEEDCLNCSLPPQSEGYENTADKAYVNVMGGYKTPAQKIGVPLTDFEHLIQTNVSEEQPTPTPSPIYIPLPEVSVSQTETPETSHKASDSPHPVYAISSFWEEMEKLTIQDILHLKVSRSPSPLRKIVDSDTSDTADSDYFTHTDDSPKPERLGCEFSDEFKTRRPASPCSGEISQDEETESSSGLVTPVDYEELAALSSFSKDSILNEDNILNEENIVIEENIVNEDRASNISLLPEFTCLIGMKKSRSMQNIAQPLEVAVVDMPLQKVHKIQDLDVVTQLKDVPILHTQVHPEDMPNVKCLETAEVQVQMKEMPNVQPLDEVEIHQKEIENEQVLGVKQMHNLQALDAKIQLQEEQDIQTLEVEFELKDILQDARKCLCLESCQDIDLVQPPVLAAITKINQTPSLVLPNTDILDKRHRITFPELYEYLFTDDVLPVSESLMSMSVPDPCCDYSPSKQSQDDKKELVPIFSCSRSATRDLTFPELEGLLFSQQDTYLQSKEDNRSSIQVLTLSDIQGKEAVSSSCSSHVYSQGAWGGNWKSLLSLRRIPIPGTGSSSWFWKSPSRVSSDVGPAQRVDPMPITQGSKGDAFFSGATRVSPTPPEVVQLGHKIFRQLSEQQRRFRSLQTTVSASQKDGILFSLTQSDMCLVCIAFASWVLRSADPMVADTWKAALLANVSAMSAIQYFRHYVVKRKEGKAEDLKNSTEDEP